MTKTWKQRYAYCVPPFNSFVKCSSLFYFLLLSLSFLCYSINLPREWHLTKIFFHLLLFEWRHSKLCKNQKINELKTYHNVYDHYNAVKRLLLPPSFACFKFKLLLFLVLYSCCVGGFQIFGSQLFNHRLPPFWHRPMKL